MCVHVGVCVRVCLGMGVCVRVCVPTHQLSVSQNQFPPADIHSSGAEQQTEAMIYVCVTLRERRH